LLDLDITANISARKAKISQTSNQTRMQGQNFHIQSSYSNQNPPGSQPTRNLHYSESGQPSNQFGRLNRKWGVDVSLDSMEVLVDW